MFRQGQFQFRGPPRRASPWKRLIAGLAYCAEQLAIGFLSIEYRTHVTEPDLTDMGGERGAVQPPDIVDRFTRLALPDSE